MKDYFHLSGALLAPGSIILPDNWGRMIRAYGWQHNCAMREYALEHARLTRFPHRPSRLDGAFVMLSPEEAKTFRRHINGFQHHLLYRVSLTDPSALSHIADSRLCGPLGAVRHDWADIYWLDYDSQTASIPGIDWATASGGIRELREMLTLSQLRIEERID
jgi:hypothetical protein